MKETNAAVPQESSERAIIIGGGISGLLTAKVLSEYYDEVWIVDKDDFPDKPENRAGTPQDFQPHRLTPRGSTIMNRLFPGFNDDLLSQGAPSSFNKIAHLSNPYGSFDMPNSENESTFSRALLEWVFRRRVKGIPNVRFLPKTDVIGLLTNAEQTIVTGISVRDRGPSRQHRTLTADLVVDSSGRSSKLVTWLQDLGYTVPQRDLLKVSLGYSTRHYHIPSPLSEEWDVIRVDGNSRKKEFTGVFSIVENNRAEMLLWSAGGHYPGTTVQEFEQNVAQLVDPLIAEVLKKLEPLTSPRGYRISELFRHHFEQMEKWPSGLLVLGDAFCNFDPIYGLGMTMAAIEVEMLEQCLSDQRTNPQPFYEQTVLQRLQDVVEPAWWLNCVSDLQWSGVEYVGQPLIGIDFAQKYFNVFLQQTTSSHNVEQFLLYWGVNSLLFSPTVMTNVQMVSSILAHASIEDNQWFTAFLQKKGQTLDGFLNQLPSFSKASFVPFPPEE
ncbi:FAD-dependent oxidoreductase [Paenibacillus xylanivorans]|uniref:FAD dependent oxidoreductase n=1 Tax=Paenibacillus xylanivorans TaxID=1705561 RepID=A0A0M9BRJ8_9BACL|nr:FAD-dependent monooxygenase [Paenibacillus xylanivorans]KOY17573.1 FAD dependent oxidoreductase [Paenibacillus xylanivorans]